MDEQARRRTTERIAALRDGFLNGLPSRVERLSALALTAGGEDRAAASAAFDGVRLGLHNLAGGAPTLGLAALGKAAATLEKRLIAGRSADGGLLPATAEELRAGIETLKTAGS